MSGTITEEGVLVNPEIDKYVAKARKEFKEASAEPSKINAMPSLDQLKIMFEYYEKIKDLAEKIKDQKSETQKKEDKDTCLELFDRFFNTYKVKWKKYIMAQGVLLELTACLKGLGLIG